MAKMQVSSSLESIICFNLKYAIDFEKVINIVNKKKLGGFPGLLVRGLPGWLFGGPGLWSRSMVQVCGDRPPRRPCLGAHRNNRPAALTQ